MISHRLKAPREHGQLLAIPRLADMPPSVERNRSEIGGWSFAPLGRPIQELRRLARREAFVAATDYVRRLDGDIAETRSGHLDRETSVLVEDQAHSRIEPPNSLCPLIVSGHQPELFHGGVWSKNFVLGQLARSMNGVGLNLIVDNDAMPPSNIAVPVGGRDAPRIERIPYAAVSGNPPWEEVRVSDKPLFRSFAERVTAAISEWSLPPILLNQIWPVACGLLDRSADQPTRLADALTAARCAAERACGLHNLELPISRLAETESFAWFVAWMLSDIGRWHAVYNDAVETYRQANRIRRVSQPVPKLARDGRAFGDERLEAPLWIWRTGDSCRRRLSVHDDGVELKLFAETELLASVPHPHRNGPANTVAALRALANERGLKLRPRALTNTLFARVFLGDTFLHGIGGAKYDEMTDQLIIRLCGLRRAPEYLTVTATFHLPLGAWSVSSADLAKRRHQLWDFDHNPERYVSPDAWPVEDRREAEQLITERQQLMAEERAKNNHSRETLAVSGNQETLPSASRGMLKAANFRRCRRLRDIRHRLAELASDFRPQKLHEWQQAQSQLAANAVLSNREFSACLFSSDLPQQLAEAAAGVAKR